MYDLVLEQIGTVQLHCHWYTVQKVFPWTRLAHRYTLITLRMNLLSVHIMDLIELQNVYHHKVSFDLQLWAFLNQPIEALIKQHEGFRASLARNSKQSKNLKKQAQTSICLFIPSFLFSFMYCMTKRLMEISISIKLNFHSA